MTKVIGVRFRQACKMYYFAPGKLQVKVGDGVIVETARGVEYGMVAMGVTEIDDEKITQPLKPVMRVATPADLQIKIRNQEKEKQAFQICLEKIKKHQLDMKLVDVEYTFDGNKILFYFIADGRIDFRELVKDLAAVFRTRIELRQIGVRDETKMKGGIGICGRCLCCHSYLSDFAPVSIKMAKEQNLSLNPSKISGVCGRLMCCLKNEEETYEYLNSKLPAIGDFVTADDGTKGEVQSVNVLRQLVKVLVTIGKDEKELREYKVEQLRFKSRKKKERPASEKAGQERPESEKPEPEKAGQKRPEAEKSDQEKAGQKRPESEKPEQEKIGQKRPESEKSNQEKTGQKRPEPEKPEQEKTGQKRPEQEKAGQKRPEQKKPAREKGVQERRKG